MGLLKKIKKGIKKIAKPAGALVGGAVGGSTGAKIGAAIGGGVASLASAKKGSKAAKAAAEATRVQPFNTSSSMGNVSFDGKNLRLDDANNPFAQIFQQLGLSNLANAGAANSAEFNGANPEIIQALKDANAAYAPDSAESQQILGQLRSIAAPNEQRMRVSQDNEQFSRGTLGTTGGAERFRALNESLLDADRKRQLDATGIATTNANQRFSNAMNTVNQGINRQQNQFNMGTASSQGIQQIFQQLLNQGGLGVSTAGGQNPAAAINAASHAGDSNLAIAQTVNGLPWEEILKKLPGMTPGLEQQASNLDWQSALPGYV